MTSKSPGGHEEQTSPELILVSEPDAAQRARDHLPIPGDGVKSSAVKIEHESPTTGEMRRARRARRTRRRRRTGRVVLVAAILVAAAAALGWYVWGRSDDSGSASARTPTTPSPGVFTPARTWVWAASKSAQAYTFEMTRNGRVVVHARTVAPRFELPKSFRFRAGAYRWTVRRNPPAAGGKILSDSRFVLTRAAAARANP